MLSPHRWSASSLKAPLNGSFPARLISGDRIQGYLAKPDGTGPFPAVVGLHGCAGMHDTTKQRLADELIAGGYVVLLVDSYATRDIDHACTSTAFATFLRRRPDAYGALVFLACQTFVDVQRVAAVGFSAGARVSLSVAEPIRSNCSSLPATCASGRRLRSIRHVSRPWRVRGYPRSSSLGPSTIGRRRQIAPIKSPAGATTGRQSSLLSIPARTMDSITRTSSPAGPCLVTGWNTTARQRTTQLAACASFSIATSTEGMPIAGETHQAGWIKMKTRPCRPRASS